MIADHLLEHYSNMKFEEYVRHLEVELGHHGENAKEEPDYIKLLIVDAPTLVRAEKNNVHLLPPFLGLRHLCNSETVLAITINNITEVFLIFFLFFLILTLCQMGFLMQQMEKASKEEKWHYMTTIYLVITNP